MDPQILVLAFLFAGLLLIFAELFLPSGGIIALLSTSCFLISGYYAYRSWYETSPLYWWMYLGGVVVLIPAAIIGAFQLLAKTSLGNRVLAPVPTHEEVTPYLEEQARLRKLIGQQGEALNLMTPGGMVLVNGERLHATSDGMVIEAGSRVEVTEVRGTRIVVRQAQPEENSLTLDTFQPDPPAKESKPLDPWLPEDDRHS